MRAQAALFLAASLAVPWLASSFASNDPAIPKQPVIVELFTSEGCSSCPPADSLLKKLSEDQPFDGIEIIALEEHVDYWNHDGWFDPFSSVEFTGRQEDYAKVLTKSDVYTPQMIVDGRAQFVGNHTHDARDQIRWAAAHPKARLLLTPAQSTKGHAHSFEMRLDPSLTVPADSRLDFYVAITEKGLSSNVKAGENSGETLQHSPVVRQLKKLHPVALPLSGPVNFSVDLRDNWLVSNLTIVVFLADPRSHEILAAGSSPVS
jgi:hypothetical protein